MASIDAIEGIGHVQATKLRKARVRTTEALLKMGATRQGRHNLAKETGLTVQQIRAWVNRADLMRVKGIGEEYSELLESVGVDTVRELGRRSPVNLLTSMVETNGHRRLVRRLPTPQMVEGWVEHAKTLDPVVKS